MSLLIMSMFTFEVPFYGLLLHNSYQVFFVKSSICKTLKTGLVLPLFNGNKDNYRGITLFPMQCKIYEMIILDRLEKFASQMQFGFQEGSGCIEAFLPYLKQLIICWKRVARCLVVSLTSGKLLTQFGLMGYCTSYCLIWMSTVNCG